jgi:hypothetical protein
MSAQSPSPEPTRRSEIVDLTEGMDGLDMELESSAEGGDAEEHKRKRRTKERTRNGQRGGKGKKAKEIKKLEEGKLNMHPIMFNASTLTTFSL